MLQYLDMTKQTKASGFEALKEKESREAESSGSSLKLSASSISKLKDCPRKWEFSYVHFSQDPPGEAAVIGTQGHEIMENFFGLDPSERTEPNLKEIAQTTWDNFYETFQETFPDTSRSELSLKQEVWQSSTGVFDFENPKKTKVHSIELPIEIVYRDIPFRGFIDRLEYNDDGTLCILDWKMGKVPKPEYTRAKIIQVLLYAWALEKIPEIEETPTKATLLYARDGVRIDVDITPKMIRLAEKEIDTAIDNLTQYFGQEFFPAKTGPLCGWCPNILECPEGRDYFDKMCGIGRMPTHAPAWGWFHQEAMEVMIKDKEYEN